VWSLDRLLEVQNRAFNRNKKSIALDFKSEEARHIFYKLAESADVIIEGFRPGVAKRLGIDYKTIKGINPMIIYCSLSGFGQSGPYVELPGHDPTYIAMGGALNMIGEADRPPIIPMNFIADFAGAALHGAIGILLALTARNKTGKGQYIDISYTDTVASLITPFAFDFLNYGVDYTRGGTPLNGGFPCIMVYATKEGKYISLGCLEPWFWENLCHFIGRDDFIPYQFDEGEKRREIFAYMRQFFMTKGRDEWFDLMKDKNIPVGKVYSLSEVFSDPQLQHRQMLQEVPLPDGSKEKTIGIAIKLSDTPGEIRSPAPARGANTKEILLGLGYTEEMVIELAQQGCISLVEV
jgi:crotonobetainyl-CoA:carnitine CoA-transferase CaiB-like acyl-CoA transferase